MSKLTPPHAQLLPAFYAWLMDNFDTVHLYINADVLNDPFLTPMAQKGVLVLNITTGAILGLHVDDSTTSFGTRFNRKHYDVTIPHPALLGIMGFDKAVPTEGHYVSTLEWLPDTEPTPEPPKSQKAHLSVVK